MSNPLTATRLASMSAAKRVSLAAGLMFFLAGLLPGAANAANTAGMDLPGVHKTFAASCLQGFRPKDVSDDKREEVCGCVAGRMVDSLKTMPQAQFDAINRSDQAAIKRWTSTIVDDMAACAKPMFQSMLRETSLQKCRSDPRLILGRDSAILPDGSDACQCIADHMGDTPIVGAFREMMNAKGEIEQSSGVAVGRKLAEDALVKARQACVPVAAPDAPATTPANPPADTGAADKPAAQGN